MSAAQPADMRIWRVCLLAALCAACSASIHDGDPETGRPDAAGGGEPPPDASSALTSTCELTGAAGAMNASGDAVAPTGTYSDWTWPQPTGGLHSLEWTLGVESEPVDGYFWSHQFAFAGVGADGGYLGLQMNGTYQADPPDGPVDITKMAVFSIAGAAIAAEVGDVGYPDGRVYGDFDGGAGWNIHVKYDWQPCRPYRLRVAELERDGDGNIWYGGHVRDLVTGDETYLGRILVPASWGGFGSWSVMWTERFGFTALTTCGDLAHGTASFLEVTGNDGAVTPTGPSNHFYDPPACPSSRFTELDGGGIRQEMGVPAGG